jgi:hypothetical protein
VTYETLLDLELFIGRARTELFARDLVAAERRHCELVLAAIDATVDSYYGDLNGENDGERNAQ